MVILTNKKSEFYDLILVIINCLTKIVPDKLVKVTTYILDLAKVICNIIIRYHSIPDSIISI